MPQSPEVKHITDDVRKKILTPAVRESIFTLPLLEQEMVYIDPLGIYVEPKKSRVKDIREEVYRRILSGEITLDEEKQFRYVTIDDVINDLSWYEAKEYAKRNGRRFLTRREWYVAREFLDSEGIENDFTKGLWEFTDSLLTFLKEGVTLIEGAEVFRIGEDYKLGSENAKKIDLLQRGAPISLVDRDGRLVSLKTEEERIRLLQRGAYIIEVDENGFPATLQTEAELFQSETEGLVPISKKPYDLPCIEKGETGVIVCAGKFHRRDLRDRSLMVVPLPDRHPSIAFRLCSDSKPIKGV